MSAVHAQSYSDIFDEAFGNNDISAQRQALQNWERLAPDDVNLFIARYNFFANRAIVQNPYSHTISIEPQLADSGLIAIEAGIGAYPNRLDLRFGKIYFLGELGMWDDFADEIIRTLDHSYRIDHRWAFPNIQEEMMVELFLESMGDYQNTMYSTIGDTASLSASDSAMLQRLRRVAKRTVQLFPDDVTSIYMLAVSHLLIGDYEKALKYLLRADEMDSTNGFVLRALAEVCVKMGNIRQAAEYRNRLKLLEN